MRRCMAGALYTSVINTNMHGWLFNDGLKGKLQDLTTEIFFMNIHRGI